MNSPWIFCGVGILFCISGIYFFYRNIYEEENRSRRWLLLMIMGVVLIAIGTAKYFKLIA
jgi:hypothetical protein